MKKSLFIGCAAAALFGAPSFAADNWTGCYLGGNAGYGSGHSTWFNAGNATTDASPKPDGFIGGGQLGCDYQAGNWVVGLEAMFDGAAMKDTRPDPNVPGNTERDRVRWFGTATARLGYAFDRTLLYAKGGAAWANIEHTYDSSVLPADSRENTQSGWVVGGGIEWVFAPSWSAKIEYNHVDLGNASTHFPVLGSDFRFSDQRIDTVMVGLNYRFGGR